MRTLAILACFCLQDPAAEKTFRAMEAKLREAPTLHVKVVTRVEGLPAGESTSTTTIHLDGAGKARIEVLAKLGARSYSLKVISDGANQTVERSETPPPPWLPPSQARVKVPADMNARVLQALVQAGASGAQEYADGQYRTAADPAHPSSPFAWPELKGFRNGPAAGTLAFDVARKGDLIATTVTLWIDPATLLPGRRESKMTLDRAAITVTETYEGWQLGAKLDPALFTLPAK